MHKESREAEKLLERIAWAITSIVGRDRIQLDLIELYPIFINDDVAYGVADPSAHTKRRKRVGVGDARLLAYCINLWGLFLSLE